MLNHPTGRRTGVILDFLRLGRGRPPAAAAEPGPVEPELAGRSSPAIELTDRLGQMLLQAEEVRVLAAGARREVVSLETKSEFVLRFDGKNDAAAFQDALRQLCLMATIYSRMQD